MAIKVLSVELESLRGEREFLAEITALSNMRHQNLVTLRGCCIEGTDRFLVYDYMENICLIHSMLGRLHTTIHSFCFQIITCSSLDNADRAIF